MIEWCKNDKLSVFFDDVPSVGIRYYLPSMTDKEKESVRKYPFICRKALDVAIFDHKKKLRYKFTIPKDYCFDGATIPRLFWRLVGSPTDNKFLIAALVHDMLCQFHECVGYDRALSTNVFNSLLEAGGVNPVNRFLMKNSVACFQTIVGKWKFKGIEVRTEIDDNGEICK